MLTMTPHELRNRYGIKISSKIGKPLYIQEVESKKSFYAQLPKRLLVTLFAFFGASMAVLMGYSAWNEHNVWYGIIGLFFSWFVISFYLSLKHLLHVTLLVVGDKGIIRYTLRYNGAYVHEERCVFTPSMVCTLKEGYVDPSSPVSKKGYRIAAIWYENTRNVFCIAYLREEDGAGAWIDKEAMYAAIEAFESYRQRS